MVLPLSLLKARRRLVLEATSTRIVWLPRLLAEVAVALGNMLFIRLSNRIWQMTSLLIAS